MAMQRVEITCPHCAHADVRFAASVKKRAMVTCPSCKRRYRVTEVRVLIGTARR
jgi:transposase-like protein